MSKRTNFAASMALILGMALPAGAQDVTSGTVLATVNGTEITVGHVLLAKDQLPQQYQQLPDDVLFQGLLEQLIQQTALADAAGELSATAQLLIDNEVRSIQAGDAIEDLLADEVTAEDVRTAYDEQAANAEPEPEFNAAHILVETEAEAQDLISQLDEGADFAELAQEFSTGPSGAQGGDLGWFGLGMMVPEFENAVTELSVGDISAPVQTQFGWHVINLIETRMTEIPSFEQLQADIREQLEVEAVDALVAGLVESAEVDRSGAEGVEPSVLSDPSILLD